MKYQIIGKNVSITEGISSSVEKKLKRIEKYFLHDEDIECRAVVSTHKDSQKIEITIFMPQFTLRAEVEHKDLYAAIDLAIDKLEGQMRKVKTKMDRSSGRMSIGDAIDMTLLKEEEEKEEKEVIVRAKSYYLTAMDIEEAALRMEALGHDFFLYLDKEDDRISVVYKRHDGGYGVIQAENPIK